jgi:hypothetical protein
MALSLVVMLLWSLAARASSAQRVRRLFVTLAAAGGIAIVALLCFQSVRDWAAPVVQRATSTSNLQEAGNVERVKLWSNSLAQIASPQSFLLGLGPGLTMVRTHRYLEKNLLGTESFLLQILIELGAAGLALFVLAFLTILQFGMTAIRHPVSGFGDRLTLGALAAVIGFVPNLVFTTAFNSWEVSCTFWLLSAFLVVSARQQRAPLADTWHQGVDGEAGRRQTSRLLRLGGARHLANRGQRRGR